MHEQTAPFVAPRSELAQARSMIPAAGAAEGKTARLKTTAKTVVFIAFLSNTVARLFDVGMPDSTIREIHKEPVIKFG